jgi:hypothetical protein
VRLIALVRLLGSVPHRAEPAQQREVVAAGPVLDDHPVGDPQNVDLLHHHGPSGRRDVLQLPEVGAAERGPDGHPVALGDDVLHLEVEVGEGGPKQGGRCQKPLPAVPMLPGPVVDELGMDQGRDAIHPAEIEELLDRRQDDPPVRLD